MTFHLVILLLGCLGALTSCEGPAQEVTNRSALSERHTSTYRLLEQVTTTTYPLPVKPTIYVIGETHLGRSQIEVARIWAEAFKQHEIDAVFLEQPDSLKFDWSQYNGLNGSRDAAIAAMQQQMLEDANQADYDFGKFKDLMDSYQKHRNDQRLESEIRQKFGPGGMDDLDALVARQEALVEATKKLYDGSKYISAADYFYLMLNLEGFRTPFWPVESLQRRQEFTIPETADRALVIKALAPRDAYMADRIDELVRQNGYKQALLICGALHIPRLPNLLGAKGYSAKVAYNALEADAIKKEMAVLVNPDHVIGIARRGPRPGFRVSDAYVVGNTPSAEILSEFDQFTGKAESQKWLRPGESKRLQALFVQQYEQSHARSSPSWTMDLVAQDGKVIRTSKDLTAGSVEIAALGPIEMAPTADPNTAIPAKPLVLTVADYGSNFQVIDLNAKGEPLYNGLSIPQVAKLANDALKADPSRTVYIDFTGLPADKAEAFSSSVRIQFARPDKQVSIRTYVGPSEQSNGTELFFARGTTIELKAAQIEEITSGEYRGWSAATLRVGSDFGQATLRIFARTSELLQQALNILRELIGLPQFQGTSVAGLVSEVRWELRRRHGVSDDDISFRFDEQFGNSQIVRLPPDLQQHELKSLTM